MRYYNDFELFTYVKITQTIKNNDLKQMLLALTQYEL